MACPFRRFGLSLTAAGSALMLAAVCTGCSGRTASQAAGSPPAPASPPPPTLTSLALSAATPTIATSRPPAAGATAAIQTPMPSPDAATAAAGSQHQQAARIGSVLAMLPGTGAAAVILPSGQWIDAGGGRRLRSASAIKLWIAAAAFDAAAAHRLDLSAGHTVRPGELASGTGILNQGNYTGQELTYARLIDIMLVYSDNAAANIITRQIGGLKVVTEYAEHNGYQQTIMQRFLGNIDKEADNYTSAHDCALFMQRLLNDQVVNAAASRSIMASLTKRRVEEDPIYDYFGRALPNDVDYRHVSGLNPGVRNDAGYYPSPGGGDVIVAIMLNDLSDDLSGEAAIARTVSAIHDVAP